MAGEGDIMRVELGDSAGDKALGRSRSGSVKERRASESAHHNAVTFSRL